MARREDLKLPFRFGVESSLRQRRRNEPHHQLRFADGTEVDDLHVVKLRVAMGR